MVGGLETMPPRAAALMTMMELLTVEMAASRPKPPLPPEVEEQRSDRKVGAGTLMGCVAE